MIIGAALLAYAASLGVLGGPRLAGRARWLDRAPMLAIAGYLAAAWSVIAAIALAGLTLAVHATALGGGLSDIVGACVRRLRDTYSAPGGIWVAVAGLGLAGVIAAAAVITAAARLRATRREGSRHARAARLVGRPLPALGAFVVDHASPAAYCVAGREPTVVLTTGALRALHPAQLAAVLAHEQAHLAGRHHLLKALARAARLVLPFIPLLREADAQVARLTELHADDCAARAWLPARWPPPWSSWPLAAATSPPWARRPPMSPTGSSGCYARPSHSAAPAAC